jgi:hypothetical protein
LITLGWLIIQGAFGAGSVWFGGAAFGGPQKAKLLWKYHRLSGYILLISLLTTVHLGGGWSTWVSEHSAYVVRLLAYTLAPVLILVSLYSRVRCVIDSFISESFNLVNILTYSHQTIEDEAFLSCGALVEFHKCIFLFTVRSHRPLV